jgi:exodeoxyribonuclease VII large subunit
MTSADFISVSELTARLKGHIEPEFRDLWVQGEISNVRVVSSGHAYFALKDADSTIAATFFSFTKRVGTKFELKDGMKVLAYGSVGIYAPRGSYQLNVSQLEPMGVGALQLQFEQLKAKLTAEGLFDPSRKRALPRYPKKIVVITSGQAAAFHDVRTVLRRRAPFVEVLLIPSLVQGADAAGKLIQALRVASHFKLGDVILLTRGGGSLEDLWCFNDEALAREIAKSEIPVVSAVGHEIDFTISDFTADLRAPTPSAGAEILTEAWLELSQSIHQMSSRLRVGIDREIQSKKRLLQALAVRVRSPRDKLREQAQRADELALRLERAMSLVLERRKSRLQSAALTLEALSPLKVLGRGFSLVSDGEGTLIRSVKNLEAQQSIEIRLVDGRIRAKIEGVHPA